MFPGLGKFAGYSERETMRLATVITGVLLPLAVAAAGAAKASRSLCG